MASTVPSLETKLGLGFTCRVYGLGFRVRVPHQLKTEPKPVRNCNEDHGNGRTCSGSVPVQDRSSQSHPVAETHLPGQSFPKTLQQVVWGCRYRLRESSKGIAHLMQRCICLNFHFDTHGPSTFFRSFRYLPVLGRSREHSREYRKR